MAGQDAWISVNKKLPKGRVKDRFLCYITEPIVGSYPKVSKRIQVHRLSHILATANCFQGGHVVTHWQDLPEVPQEEKKLCEGTFKTSERNIR